VAAEVREAGSSSGSFPATRTHATRKLYVGFLT